MAGLVKQITMAIVADAGTARAEMDSLVAQGDDLKKPIDLKIVAATGEAQAEVSAVTDALIRYNDAALKADEASAKLAQVQADDAASSGELSAAMNANADATQRALDAQIRLLTAEERAAVGAKEEGAAQETAAAKADAGAASASGAAKHLGMMALAAGAVGVGSVNMAMKWDEASTQLVTGAGESDKALAAVKSGMLQVSNQTATSSSQVQAGMYMIESAGYHGAAGLKVLQAAAEGAKVGNADLGTVADATTTVLTDYKMGAGSAAAATSGLVAVVAAGKTHMEDLAASVSRVLPTAAALNVGFAQVGGTMATMTGEGTSAKLAAMGINTAMLALAAPSKVAAKEMSAMGLSSKQVADTLTHQGLIAALKEVTDAALKAGPVGSAPYVASLKTMVGGNRGLQVALETTGTHFSTLLSNYDSVAKASDSSAAHVQGWAKVQEDAKFKEDQLKVEIHNTGIAIGEVLMPAVSKILGPIDSFAGGILKSKTETDILVTALVSALAGYAIVKTVSGFKSLTGALGDIWTGIGKLIPALGAQTVATEAATVAQTEADVAMDANPIGLVVLAIAALIAVIVLVVTHWKLFKQYAVDAFHFVVSAGEEAFGWVKSHWPLILAILTGPIGIAVLIIKSHWNQIVSGAATAIHDVGSWFLRLPGMVLGWVGSFGRLLWNAGASLLHGLIGGIESEVGNVVGIVTNVGSSVLHGIEGALGIGSPSTKMRTRGQFAGQGLALGLTDSVSMVGAASRQLAAATLGGYTGGSAAGGGAAPGGGGTQVVLSLAPGGSGMDQLLFTYLQKQIRVHGGDPRILTQKVSTLK
jgi:TP901 family phage tail tape measure protein